MKFNQFSTLFSLALATRAFVIPSHSAISAFDPAIAGSIAYDNASVYFELPCSSCSTDGSDLTLHLTFEIDVIDRECALPATTPFRLEGVGLSGDHYPKGDTIGLRVATSKGWADVVADWDGVCLHGKGSYVWVVIKQVNDYALASLAGFAISFSQQDSVKVFRLATLEGKTDVAPLPESIWLSQILDKQTLSHEVDYISKYDHLDDTQPAIEKVLIENTDLERLKQQIFEAQDRLAQQQQDIVDLLIKDFESCQSYTCYWQIFLSKAQAFLDLARSQVKQGFETARHACSKAKGKMAGNANGLFRSLSDMQAATYSTGEESVLIIDSLHEPDHNQPPFCFDDNCDPEIITSHVPIEIFRSRYDNMDTYTTETISCFGAGCIAQIEPEMTPTSGGWLWHVGFFLVGFVGTFIVLILLTTIFKIIGFFFANPRVKADRRARFEERRNQRLYRKAARKHRCRQFFARLFGRNSVVTEISEKQALALEEGNSLHIVGEDIATMSAMVEAIERGVVADMSEKEPCSDTASLPPSYRSGQPPRYSQELPQDTRVVAGFTYTPTASEGTPVSSASSFIIDDDSLTESSVVDCRSRISMDTERIVVEKGE